MQAGLRQTFRALASEKEIKPRKTMGLWIQPLVLCLAISALGFTIVVFSGDERTPHGFLKLLRGGETASKSMLEMKGYSDISKRCRGKHIYMYSLPPEFNVELVEKCKNGSRWFALCGNLENFGLGPRLPRNGNVSTDRLIFRPETAWYRTEQFSLEVLFHERMKRFPCLTDDPTIANAFYIPFYGGLDIGFNLFIPHMQVRDRLSQRLVGWLSGNPIWKELKGRRHFLTLGRISWDFSRLEESNGWGSALFSQLELENVTRLMIEKKPGSGNEIAIPYPSSFHPSSNDDVQLWQETLNRGARRKWLATFVGSTRRGGNSKRSLREELIDRCEERKGVCKVVRCNGGRGSVRCGREPEEVVRALGEAVFCLQPRGDSPTRKALFDSLVAGCIPVLFANSSAYEQYGWHLPEDGSLYSIYFPEEEVLNGKVNVLSELGRVSEDRIRRMQATIVELLPRIVYGAPPSNNGDGNGVSAGEEFRDAFVIAVEALLRSLALADDRQQLRVAAVIQ